MDVRSSSILPRTPDHSPWGIMLHRLVLVSYGIPYWKDEEKNEQVDLATHCPPEPITPASHLESCRGRTLKPVGLNPKAGSMFIIKAILRIPVRIRPSTHVKGHKIERRQAQDRQVSKQSKDERREAKKKKKYKKSKKKKEQIGLQRHHRGRLIYELCLPSATIHTEYIYNQAHHDHTPIHTHTHRHTCSNTEQRPEHKLHSPLPPLSSHRKHSPRSLGGIDQRQASPSWSTQDRDIYSTYRAEISLSHCLLLCTGILRKTSNGQARPSS